MQFNHGDIVERYQIESLLGEGGMAVVYSVRHTTLGTHHALKLLTLTNPKIRERLIREGKVQAGLKHPNVVTVTDVLDVDGAPALLMEKIDGPDLHHWLQEHQPDLDQACHIFDCILSAIEHAHGLDIIHRDLKPANVLMAQDHQGQWVPKVTDFGLAKALARDADPSSTRTGQPMGTPAYMSPEQIRDAKNVDQRTDIFALGCILYELLCGQRTFVGMDTLDVFNRVVSGSFVPPEIHKRDISPPHRQAILGCLSKDIDQRIPDCSTLRRVFNGEQDWECPAPASDTVDFGSDDTLDFEAPTPLDATPLSLAPPEAPKPQKSRNHFWSLRAPLTFGILIVLLWVGLPDPNDDEDIALSPSPSEVLSPNSPSNAAQSNGASSDDNPVETTHLPATGSNPIQPLNESDAPQASSTSSIIQVEDKDEVDAVDEIDEDVPPPPRPRPQKKSPPSNTPAATSDGALTASYRVTGDAQEVRLSSRFDKNVPPGAIEPNHYKILARFGEEELHDMGSIDIDPRGNHVIHCDSVGQVCNEVSP